MQFLIDLLRSQPILILLLAAWVIGAVSNVVQRQRRQQEKQQQRGARRPADGRENAPRRPTAEEVAAEMRRALGLDPRPEKGPEKPAAAKPPKPPAALKPAPQPLSRSLSRVQSRAAPSVGERMEARPTPASGAVGAQALGTQSLGTLGGRAGARAARPLRGGSAFVDLRDLPRAFVMREILDPPLALREPRV